MFMCLSQNLCGCTLVRNWVLRPKTGDIFTWLGRVPLSSSFLKIYRVNVYQAFDIFLVLSCTLQENVHGLPFNGLKNSAGQNKCMKHIVKLIVVWVSLVLNCIVGCCPKLYWRYGTIPFIVFIKRMCFIDVWFLVFLVNLFLCGVNSLLESVSIYVEFVLVPDA